MSPVASSLPPAAGLKQAPGPLTLAAARRCILRRPDLLRVAPTLLLLGFSCHLVAVDDSVRIQDFSIADVHPMLSEGAVAVKGFSLVPMAYHEGLIQLHPKLMIGAGYDSNVFAASSGASSDEYLNTVAGVQGQVEFSETSRAYTDTEVEARDFRKEHTRAALVGRAYAQFEQDIANGSQIQATGSYVRSDDPLIESGYEVDHGEVVGGAQYSYEGIASRVTVRADYENARFYTGDAFFTPHSRDYDIYRGTVLYGFRKGEYSEFIIRLSVDTIRYLNHDAFQGGDGVSAIAGWRGAAAPKVAATLGVGIEARRFTNDFAGDPAYMDKRVARPVGLASLKWDLEEGSFLALRSFSELVPSEISNAMWYYGISTDLRYRLMINAAAIGSIQLSHSRESGAATGMQVEQRDDRSVSGGLEYFLREGVGTRVVVEYDNSRSHDYNSFTRWTARLEMAVAY